MKNDDTAKATDTGYTMGVEHDVEVRSEAFGVFDTKGREIGSRVRTYTITYQAANDDEIWQYEASERPVGSVVFGFDPSATRDGNDFGATQMVRDFGTEDQRDAAIEKYLTAARSRALKSRLATT